MQFHLCFSAAMSCGHDISLVGEGCNMGNKGSILYNFTFSHIFCNMAGICMHHVRDVKNALSLNIYKYVRC